MKLSTRFLIKKSPARRQMFLPVQWDLGAWTPSILQLSGEQAAGKAARPNGSLQIWLKRRFSGQSLVRRIRTQSVICLSEACLENRPGNRTRSVITLADRAYPQENN